MFKHPYYIEADTLLYGIARPSLTAFYENVYESVIESNSKYKSFKKIMLILFIILNLIVNFFIWIPYISSLKETVST